MRFACRFVLVPALLVAPVSLVLFAEGYGGGGMTTSYQLAAPSGVVNYEATGPGPGLSYVGGFGYGVDGRGQIRGGFGYAVVDRSDERGIKGGMAGFISGYRFISQPFNLSLVSWTGFGGVSTGNSGSHPQTGYFCVSEELDLELGLPIARWFMPTLFVGYQAIGNLAPGPVFQSFFTLAPTAGIRLTWGKFR